MGASQSTRKLTVDNDNAIQVSQEALDRIQAQLSSQMNQPQPVQIQSPVQVPAPEYRAPITQLFDYQTSAANEQATEEAYWNRRIENLKKAHEKINAAMDIEYKKTLKEANELFHENKKATAKLPPCQEEKAKVLECYTTNPDKSLLCSVLVNQFNDCVCRSRIAAVTAS